MRGRVARGFSRGWLRFGANGARFWMAVTAWLVLVCAGVKDARAASFLTTTELRQMLGNPRKLVGIEYNRTVGLAFQRAVLRNLPGGKMMPSNTKSFASAERRDATQGRLLSVIPDGLTGASEGSPTPMPMFITTYPESTFIEVKAVKGTLGLAYGKQQLRGMIDVLSRSQAASSVGERRAYPSLHFIITGDANVATELQDHAAKRKVLVWLSSVLNLGGGDLQVTSPICLNCTQVLDSGQKASTLPPGPVFTIPKLGAGVPDSLDAPILDDRSVGHPGAPGDTTPNP
jgi:hypothetical protein